MDADGHLVVKNNNYDLILVNERLLDETIFLARSLGLAAYKSVCQKTCTNSANGPVTGTYYRTCISGDNLHLLPMVLERKKARPRQLNKSVLVSGCTIEPAGFGPYYQFDLNGSRKNVLLEDFTVISAKTPPAKRNFFNSSEAKDDRETKRAKTSSNVVKNEK